MYLYHSTNLDEVKACVDVVLHDEYGQMAVRVLDAVVEHAHEDLGVVVELHHELLVFLHYLHS